MRSLLLRWGVAVVVGTLWGAIVSPRTPYGSHGAKTTSLVSDAAHYAQSAKAGHWFVSSGDNPMNL
jgi:hypothetical protein